MMGIYTIIAIAVGVVTLGSIFLKLAFQMGQLAQQVQNVVKAIDGITEQVTELFEWRYQDAIRNQKRRGGLPRD
jgi:uncharacterized protein YoxC